MVTDEQVARHRDHLTALSVDGEPLSATCPHATTRNPVWFSPATGRATPERMELHRAILTSALEQTAHVPKDHQAIVLAGPPGAGKTRVLEEVLSRSRDGAQADPANWRTLNSDDFKDDLLDHAIADGSYETFLKAPVIRDLEAAGEKFYPRELAALVHGESSFLMRQATAQALALGQNIVIDGTLSRSTRAHQMLEELARAGYEVSVVDVEAPREVTQERVAARWRHDYLAVESGTATGPTATLGGRWVPTSFSGALYGAGRDDRSVCEDVAAEVAARHQVVRQFDLYRVTGVDASPTHVARRGRVGDSDLLDAATYAAQSVGAPSPARHTTPKAPEAPSAAATARAEAAQSFPTSARDAMRGGRAAKARNQGVTRSERDRDQGLGR